MLLTRCPPPEPGGSPAKKAPRLSAGPTPAHPRAARALVADVVENLVGGGCRGGEASAGPPGSRPRQVARGQIARGFGDSLRGEEGATPKSAGPTLTLRRRARVDAAIENLTAAEQAESAVPPRPPGGDQVPAKKAPTRPSSRQEGGNLGEVPRQEGAYAQVRGSHLHTRAARALVADAVENLVAAEAAEARGGGRVARGRSLAAKSPASVPRRTRARRDIVAAAVAAVVADEADVAMAEASRQVPREEAQGAVGFASPTKSPGIPKSPRPSLKAPEMRIGAVPPGSAQRRKSLRFVADADMEQVRFIPPHNGEPELCGRIAPNQHVSLEKRKRTPNKRYADAEEEADEEMPDAAVNRVGDVGHTGPIPKFTAVVAEEAAASPKSGGRKRSLPLSSPLSTGGSKRAAVSLPSVRRR